MLQILPSSIEPTKVGVNQVFAHWTESNYAALVEADASARCGCFAYICSDKNLHYLLKSFESFKIEIMRDNF